MQKSVTFTYASKNQLENTVIEKILFALQQQKQKTVIPRNKL